MSQANCEKDKEIGVVIKFEDLAPELQEKIKSCKTRKEFDQAIKEAGIELSEEALDVLSGGIACPTIYCDTLELMPDSGLN